MMSSVEPLVENRLLADNNSDIHSVFTLEPNHLGASENPPRKQASVNQGCANETDGMLQKQQEIKI